MKTFFAGWQIDDYRQIAITMSQGEIFTLQLKKFTNAKSYGQTTKGTIAYGVNESGMEKLPSGRYGATMTDIRDSRNYLVYEDVGVAPDHVLDNTGNWTDRLVKEIEKR